MTSKNDRAPLLYYIKLCVSFQIHRWIQTEFTLRKRSILVKIIHFLSLVTLKFDGWPRKMIGRLFYTTSSFVYHFKSIGEFKLNLHSGNAQFWSKSAIFCPLWPWNLMDDLGKEYGTSSILHQALCTISNPSVNWNWIYNQERLNSGQNGRFFVLCDLEIWWITLENNRAPLLCCFKLCASFHSHQGMQTVVTVRKRPILVKIDDFFSRVTLKFNGWPSQTIGHLFYATSSFVQHFIVIGEFKLELQSGNAQSGSNSTIFRAVRPWNLTDDLAKQ